MHSLGLSLTNLLHYRSADSSVDMTEAIHAILLLIML